MKKIHDIISSELVVRRNNINFRQEFGEVGHSSNIRNVGDTTIFSTEFGIDKILYLTVNGVNLIEGVHFYVDSSFEIFISNNGDPLKEFNNQTVNILVAYLHNGRRKNLVSSRIPPVITTFYLDTVRGTGGKVVFDFSIQKNDGYNIYWSILKNGEETPLYSGSALYSTNGKIIDSSGNIVDLEYFITQDEYLKYLGGDITFTLVVVYDLTQDGSHLDEKLLKDAKYTLIDIAPVTGNISSIPQFINTTGDTTITIDYSTVNVAGSQYEWRIQRSIDGGTRITLDSGNSFAAINGTVTDTFTHFPGDNKVYRYYLDIKYLSSTGFVTLATDRTNAIIPVPSSDGRAGHLDTNIFYYQDGSGTWRTIGYDGSASEYNRVPREVFTFTITKSMLDSGIVIDPPVYNPSGTITEVQFIAEIPEAWGPVIFAYQTGDVDPASFNIINLGNGFVSYIYAPLSSPVSNTMKVMIKKA